MEFRLDEAQVGLQETVERYCEDRLPLDTIAAREGSAVDRDAWRSMAELGVLSLLADEESGGAGLGPVEAALVFEQLGRHLVPGPVMWTLLAATVLPGAASGELVVGGVDGGAVVDGEAIVEHGSDLDALLVFRPDGVEMHRLQPPRVEGMPAPVVLDPLDPLTPVSRLSGLSGGEVLGDAALSLRLRTLGHVLIAATLSGIASRSLEVARAYASEREQFGVPVGSFQAVKHMLADMYVRSSLAQSEAYAAAAVLGDPGGDDPAIAASAAMVVAADAAVTNAGTAVQVLGGMGFTWDMLPNYLLKRARVLEQSLEPPERHARRVGAALMGASTGAAI